MVFVLICPLASLQRHRIYPTPPSPKGASASTKFPKPVVFAYFMGRPMGKSNPAKTDRPSRSQPSKNSGAEGTSRGASTSQPRTERVATAIHFFAALVLQSACIRLSNIEIPGEVILRKEFVTVAAS